MNRRTADSKLARTGQRSPKERLKELREQQEHVRRRTKELERMASSKPFVSGSVEDRKVIREAIEEAITQAEYLRGRIAYELDAEAAHPFTAERAGKHISDDQTAELGLQTQTAGRLLEEFGKLTDEFSKFSSELHKIIQLGGIAVDPKKMGSLEGIQEFLRQARSTKSIPRLNVSEGTTWDSVIIRFISEDAIEIRANKTPLGVRNFIELGFSDARKGGNSPNKLWTTLGLFASGRGELPTGVLDAKEKNFYKKRVSDLGRRLKLVFGIKDNPFHPYRKSRSYRAKFIISKRDEADDEPDANEYKTDLQEQQQARRTKLGRKYDKGITADIKKDRSSDESD